MEPCTLIRISRSKGSVRAEPKVGVVAVEVERTLARRVGDDNEPVVNVHPSPGALTPRIRAPLCIHWMLPHLHAHQLPRDDRGLASTALHDREWILSSGRPADDP